LIDRKDLTIPLLVSFLVCIVIFNIGTIYHYLAYLLYSLLNEILPHNNLPEPKIQESVIKMLATEFLTSPSESLQLIKSLISLSSALSGRGAFAAVQLFIEIISLFNLYISWRYGTYVLSLTLSLSLIIAYYQVEIFLVEYLMSLLSYLLNHVVTFT